MSNLNSPKPKRIDEAVLQNMKCRYSLELFHFKEENFTIYYLYQFLDKLKPTERVFDVWMPSEFNQGHLQGSFNIHMGNMQAFIDKIRGYDILFLNCHPGCRVQIIDTMLSMQVLENLVYINSSSMTDWHQVSFTVEQ